MNCRDFVESSAEYLAGELAGPRHAGFEAHQARCPWCVPFRNTYQHAVRLAKAAHAPPADQAAGNVPEQLVQAVLATRGQRRAAEICL